MKKNLLIFAALAASASVSFGQGTGADISHTLRGDVYGKSANAKLGFHGKQAVVQDAATTSAYQSAVNHGFIASGTDFSQQTSGPVSISSANILGMFAAPVQVLPAPGAGKTIIVDRVFVRLTRTATAYAAGGATVLQYGATVNGAGTNAADSTLAATYFTGASGVSEAARNGAVLSDQGTALQNLGLFISNATAAFTTGTGTAVVEVWYHVL